MKPVEVRFCNLSGKEVWCRGLLVQDYGQSIEHVRYYGAMPNGRTGYAHVHRRSVRQPKEMRK